MGVPGCQNWTRAAFQKFLDLKLSQRLVTGSDIVTKQALD